ncbi:MAG: hypothetical protein LQ350_008074 [Teloschistes chrysophthalmus]|nr:MAG: hypothetical protein LQ350_008074 [Niorma chrysophthalma]
MTSVVVDGCLDVSAVRSHFPTLTQKQVFLDNAGGSQVLSDAINSIRTYLEETNVQLRASYNVGQKATEKYNEGFKAAAEYMNANVDEIVIGPSTTQLFANLSQAFALSFPADSEIICSSIDHEANISSWVRLSKIRNLKLKWWTPSAKDPSDLKLTPENLRPLLSEKTKMVTCTHISNILGTIHDIKAIADEVHKIPGAVLCVDGVAYAPHREVDVKALGVYGPHIAVLYASQAAQQNLSSLGHYFHTPADTLATKLRLAAASYELVGTIPSILSYFGPDRKETWSAIATHEEKLQSILLDYLNKREDINRKSEKSPAILAHNGSDTTLSQQSHSLALEYLSINLAIRDREKLIEVLCHHQPDLLTKSIRELVKVYDPIIRGLHNAVDLASGVTDAQSFIDDLLALALLDKNKRSKVPTVQDFVHLLEKHQRSSHVFIHQALKNGKELKQWYHDYAIHAVMQYRQESRTELSSLHAAAAGDLTSSLNSLVSKLSDSKKQTIIKELDSYATFLDSLAATSHDKMHKIVRASLSAENNATKIEGNPGMFLYKWQYFIDSTVVTPSAEGGSPRTGGNESVKDATAVDVDGSKPAAQGSGEEVGIKPSAVENVLRLIGPGFERELRRLVDSNKKE